MVQQQRSHSEFHSFVSTLSVDRSISELWAVARTFVRTIFVVAMHGLTECQQTHNFNANAHIEASEKIKFILRATRNSRANRPRMHLNCAIVVDVVVHRDKLVSILFLFFPLSNVNVLHFCL